MGSLPFHDVPALTSGAAIPGCSALIVTSRAPSLSRRMPYGTNAHLAISSCIGCESSSQRHLIQFRGILNLFFDYLNLKVQRQQKQIKAYYNLVGIISMINNQWLKTSYNIQQKILLKCIQIEIIGNEGKKQRK
ncbi:hypothetical protein FGO68_gene15055 [Halteria grandinella]|uniref:Uncharacterized protein n=1 Tax=Halteria grandinella TaxID=5974 RepID=A0A8J8P6H4_HALGN|nr:hypothetical protein FGO68_gene15055 [Halteria grandinella]